MEYATSLPDDHKIGAEGGKLLLRRAMKGVLPDPILTRPKRGFPVPLASWLKGPLRGFVRDTLLAPQSGVAQYADRHAVSRIVEDHEHGRGDRSMEIWMLMVFEFWRRGFIAGGVKRSYAA